MPNYKPIQQRNSPIQFGQTGQSGYSSGFSGPSYNQGQYGMPPGAPNQMPSGYGQGGMPIATPGPGVGQGFGQTGQSQNYGFSGPSFNQGAYGVAPGSPPQLGSGYQGGMPIATPGPGVGQGFGQTGRASYHPLRPYNLGGLRGQRQPLNPY